MAEQGSGASGVVESISGPVYVPPAGAAPALSEFRVSYWPHRQRQVVAELGMPWRHTVNLSFWLSTDQNVDRTPGAIRPAVIGTEEVSYPNGADQPPLHTFRLVIPTTITQCDLVVAEKAHNHKPIVHVPVIYPLDVPAAPPAEDGDDN